MQKYIYKITNNITNKAYIGQTNDPKRRFQEHKAYGYNKDTTSNVLYRAMQKYGIENFTFEIIEGPIENYNEREKYWIEYYNTYLGNENSQGYNLTSGGEEPPVFHGEHHHLATHTWEQINQIKYLLKNTKTSILDIAKTFDYSRSSIERINKGVLWNVEDEEYPLRKEVTQKFLEERAEQITNDLLNTNMTQKEIAAKYGVGRTTITAINNGQNYHKDYLSYPLRKGPVHKTNFTK